MRECPVSYITPESIETVQHFARARHVFQSLGASLYGSDMSAWPEQAVEFATTLEIQRIQFENERSLAERRD